MIPEIAAVLDPLAQAVIEAEHDLADINSDPDAHPLESLKWAGRLIKLQGDMINACWRLLDEFGDPVTNEDLLRIQGRVRAADALKSEGK